MPSLGGVSDGARKNKKMLIMAGSVVALLVIILMLVVAVGGYVYYIKHSRDGARGGEESLIEYPTDGLLVINVTTSVVTTSMPTTSAATTSVIASTSVSTSVPTTSIQPTCSDGIQNQGETGVDCGGPCPNNPPCLAACLSAKAVKLYTRSGIVCSQCSAVRNYFGSAYPLLNSEDCEDEGDRANCIDELEGDYDVDSEDLGFPTWIIYGNAYPGASLRRVRDLTDC